MHTYAYTMTEYRQCQKIHLLTHAFHAQTSTQVFIKAVDKHPTRH